MTTRLHIEIIADCFDPGNLLFWLLKKKLVSGDVPSNRAIPATFFLENGASHARSDYNTIHIEAGVQELTFDVPLWYRTLCEEYFFNALDVLTLTKVLISIIEQESWKDGWDEAWRLHEDIKGEN